MTTLTLEVGHIYANTLGEFVMIDEELHDYGPYSIFIDVLGEQYTGEGKHIHGGETKADLVREVSIAEYSAYSGDLLNKATTALTKSSKRLQWMARLQTAVIIGLTAYAVYLKSSRN